jgi:CHAT domain-containing protein
MSAAKFTAETLPKLIGKLSRLRDETSRRTYVSRHPRVIDPIVVEQLADAAREHIRVDIARALSLAESAVLIASHLNDGESLAHAFRAKANALYVSGQCEAAVELLEKAEGLFGRAGKPGEVGRTLSTSIQPLSLLGAYDRALSAAERARDIFIQTGEGLRVARLEINVANVLQRRGRLSEALAAYDRAYHQLLSHGDSEGVGVALHNMAVCLIGLNDFQRSLETYEKARTFCLQNRMPLLASQADYNIAYLHYLHGEYGRALEMLRRTREACRANSDAYHSALCDLDQSEIYLELNLLDEGEQLASQALAQFQQLRLSYETMKSLANLGIAVSRMGKTHAALKLFSQARRQAAAEHNPIWARLIDLYRALVLFDQGRDTSARSLVAAVARFFASYPLPGKAAASYTLLARIDLQAGNLDSAYLHCELAMEQLRAIDAPMLNHRIHLCMGQIQEAQGDAQAAESSYQTARLSLETLRSSLQNEELKIAFMQDRQDVYERLIQLCVARCPDPKAAEQAFAYMEEAKSRSLRDVLLGRLQGLYSPDTGESGQEGDVRAIRRELNWYYKRIESEQLSRESVRPEIIQQLLAEARVRENELQRALRENSLQKRNSELQISETVALEDVRAALNADTALVEYCRIGERMAGAVLTPTDLEIVPLGSLSRVRELLRSLQFQLSRCSVRSKSAAFENAFLEAARFHLKGLYDEVLRPLRSALRCRHLVIVPNDVLHHLPFHALHDGQRYLIESVAVSYAPSASILSLCSRRAANVAGPALVLGVPDANAPQILHEVQTIAATVAQSETFVGLEANFETLKRRGAVSRMIHIATHGFFRQDNPLFSGIRLGDSYVCVHDLYPLQLPVQLLTLSGCSTGLNVITAGDELLGLSRGLLCAGAQSVLLSLWNVDDTSTAKLMQHFYGLLQVGYGKADALQAAMLEIMEEHPHPYYWAPFVLIGSPSEITTCTLN